MLDKVLFVFLKILPILGVLTEVDLVYGPEAGHLVLIHLPDVVVLNRQQNEAVRVVLKEWLRLRSLTLCAVSDAQLRCGGDAL